ncbi:MAG: ribonuclease P protein component [Deltaproteobacteria bacterium]|nr:ribonuclease P protein component [Deltaproteobacteria bacterium]
MAYETGRFQQADRILSTRDFGRVVKSGKRTASGSFVVVIASRMSGTKRESDENRRKLGVTVSKRVGNAVVRNRVKRCIREWFRHAREGLPEGSEIVVIARRKARDLLGCEIASVLDQMIQREEGRRGAV